VPRAERRAVAHDPIVLVTPETGPSALQARLAGAPPVPASAGEPRLDAAIEAFHARTRARRGYLAVDKPLYKAAASGCPAGSRSRPGSSRSCAIAS
jgi:hypothetical protein